MTETLPFPESWATLEAPETRFELINRLYDISKWDHGDSVRDFANYIHFFLDDHDFLQESQGEIGISIFSGEDQPVLKFAAEFSEYIDKLPDEACFGEIKKSRLNMPMALIQRADDLYNLLIQRGDPEVVRYKRRNDN